MTWKRALEADARRAAKNAVLIRAALRQSFDAERAFLGYQNSTPNLDLDIVQQRRNARAWAIMNVRPNMEPLREVLFRCWLEGYALGDAAAREALDDAKRLQKADTQADIDWSKWKPGDEIQALILKPPRAFQRLIEQAGFTLKGFSETTLTDIGNSIGEAITLGLSAKQSAKLIRNHVASPARALTIAITEQNRAISAATLARYTTAGVQEVEWLVFDPCKICAENAGKKARVNAPFPSGATQPPAHPNCRCALAPVIPGMNETEALPGAVNVTPPNINVVEPAQVVTPVQRPTERLTPDTFVPGKWEELSREKIRERTRAQLIERFGRVGYTEEEIDRLIATHSKFKADRSLIEKGAVFINGNVEVQFHSGGTSVTPKRKKEIVEWVDKLQTTNPKGKVTVIIGPSKRGAYGWATLNGDKIWIAPKTAKIGEPNRLEGGSYKMPALLENPQWKYTLSHEWGHHIDDGNAWYGQSGVRVDSIMRLKEQFKDVSGVFISGYAKEKNAEFLAEMFAEWMLTEGKTTNPLIQAMAKEFGWMI